MHPILSQRVLRYDLKNFTFLDFSLSVCKTEALLCVSRICEDGQVEWIKQMAAHLTCTWGTIKMLPSFWTFLANTVVSACSVSCCSRKTLSLKMGNDSPHYVFTEFSNNGYFKDMFKGLLKVHVCELTLYHYHSALRLQSDLNNKPAGF